MHRTWLLMMFAVVVGCDPVEERACERVEEVEHFADLDGDGFGAGFALSSCPSEVPEDRVLNQVDCDDEDENINPDATEFCNQIDDNCDGQTDEGYVLDKYFIDVDGDGFGARFPAVATCGEPPVGYVGNDLDCNDNNNRIHPDAPEICNAGRDDNCDGRADDGDPNTLDSSKLTFYEDRDADGLGNLDRGRKLCTIQAGLVDNFVDCNDRNREITNTPFPADNDLDGYGDAVATVMSCEGYPGTAVACEDREDNPDMIPCTDGNNRDDCDDSDPMINIPKEWYTDLDGDGYGELPAESFGCFPPNEPSTGPFVGDCNDSDETVFAGADEICDDGIDQNCDGLIDCLDGNCNDRAECQLECVDEGITASEATFSYTVSMAGATNDFSASCITRDRFMNNGPEVVLQWTVPETGSYALDTFDSRAQRASLSLHEDCDFEDDIACNMYSFQRGDGNYYKAFIPNVALKEGDRILIVVHGATGRSGAVITDSITVNVTKQ